MTREEAIEILKDTLYDERTPNNYIQAVRIAREALENQKTGHWIDKKVKGCIKPHCSICRCALDVLCHYDYCPNCGTYMKGENK